MATPSYVALTNFVRGVTSAEAAINVESVEQTWNNPKDYALDRYGGRVGYATNYDPDSTVTVSGEVSTAALTGVFGAAWATGLTIANATSGFGVTTGGWYLENLSITQNRGGFQTASMDAIRIPGLT